MNETRMQEQIQAYLDLVAAARSAEQAIADLAPRREYGLDVPPETAWQAIDQARNSSRNLAAFAGVYVTGNGHKITL